MSFATSNAFALLKGSKNKKDDKSKDDKKKRGKDDKSASAADLEKAIFSQPSLNISNWADDDEEDYTMPSLPADWAEVSCLEAVGEKKQRARRAFASATVFFCPWCCADSPRACDLSHLPRGTSNPRAMVQTPQRVRSTRTMTSTRRSMRRART